MKLLISEKLYLEFVSLHIFRRISTKESRVHLEILPAYEKFWSLDRCKSEKHKLRRKGMTLHEMIKRRISSVTFLKNRLLNYGWLISIQIHQCGMYFGRNIAINCIKFNLIFWISSLWALCAVAIIFWQSFTNALLQRIYFVEKNAPFPSYGRPPACVLIKTREIIPCRLHTASIILKMLACALR